MLTRTLSLRLHILLAISLVVSALAPALARGGETIWVEGESATRHDFHRHGWYDRVLKDSFSGQEWLSHYHSERPGVATYTLEARGGEGYIFWLRCNYFKSRMAYRLDGGEWQEIDLDASDPGRVRDTMMISRKPDHRFIGWVRVGPVKLAAGKNRLDLRISSPLANHGGIDCFLLTDEGVVPSGSTRPDVTSRAGPATWFPVVVDEDPHSPESVWDQSEALHRPAGKYGHLKRSGKDLEFEKGRGSVKFWGVGANVKASESREEMVRRARYLAKMGVNMVREHPLSGFLGARKGGKFDAGRLEKLDLWFSILKEHGIYSTWSVFYRHRLGPEERYPAELREELENGDTYGLVNLSRPLQDLRLEYVKALLEHRNPHTGLRYRDDPALAVLEIQNEDCIFFHFPLSVLAEGEKWPRHSRMLRRRFHDWSLRRHRSSEKLVAFWGRRVDVEKRELDLYPAWQLRGQKMDPRQGEFVEFLTELQREYYERRERELRDAGFRGVTVTTAWRAGGAGADAANLYCDTAMDMIDRHNYFGGGEERHRIVAGKVKAGTHLERPGSGILSSGLYQVEDRPFAMTEWTQSPPNPWKAECAPLVAFYGMGLQGWDASYHFTSSRSRLGDGWPGLSYYTTDTPHYAGQFPALAIAVRDGHVEEGPIVAARRVRPGDLYRGADVLGQDLTGGGHDQKSLVGQPVTPPEVLAIGRVTTSFEGGRSFQADLEKYWKPSSGKIISATGELEWDTRGRVVRVLAKKTQAVIGFGGGRRHELPAFDVELETPFVSLIFTSLDDRPLERSRSILITAMARDRQTGAEYSEAGDRLEVVGGPPLLLEPVQARIHVKDQPVRAVEVLDFHGVPRSIPGPEVEDGAFTIDGRFRASHYHLRR